MLRKRVRIRDSENFWKYTPETVGKFEMPIIRRCPSFSVEDIIPATIAQSEPAQSVIHFYIDDFQFERFWRSPERYISFLKNFKGVIGPDFSSYTDMPLPLRIYNEYRNKWLSSFWQKHEVKVIPNVTWPIGKLEEFYLDGHPQRSMIAISIYGLNRFELEQFQADIKRIVAALSPELILLYGSGVNIINMQSVKQFSPYTPKRRMAMAKGASGKGSSGYATKDFVPAPKDQLTQEDIVKANKAGLKHRVTGDYWSYYTPVLQRAYDIGHSGQDLKDAPVVKGIRYGKAPASGISRNYAEGKSEKGLSLAQEHGKEEIGSSMWFADRKAYEYRGVKVGTGSDGETIILPLHVPKLD